MLSGSLIVQLSRDANFGNAGRLARCAANAHAHFPAGL
jgi:hypothetical protein